MSNYFFRAIFITCLCFGAIYCRPSKISAENENKLHFLYYPSPDTEVEIVYNDTSSLRAANLKPATKTIFIIDGFTAPPRTPMGLETKNTFSGRADTNVIIVDWSAYSGNGQPFGNNVERALLYIKVTFQGIPKAANDLADFLNFLNTKSGINFEDMIIIGHSMGCHTAGYGGRMLISKYGKQVSRIVGLDPSFQMSKYDSELRLRTGDASVVEVYITNREWYGDRSLIVGDVTIFVNGGNNQPCRLLPEDSIQNGIDAVTCNDHRFSWKFYNQIANNATLKACPCRGATCLCQGCGRECGEAGISIGPLINQEARGSYHVKTGLLDWSS